TSPDTRPTTPTVVPLRLANALGVPMLFQSSPASPPTLTSSVRPAVVGASLDDTAASRLVAPPVVALTTIMTMSALSQAVAVPTRTRSPSVPVSPVPRAKLYQ